VNLIKQAMQRGLDAMVTRGWAEYDEQADKVQFVDERRRVHLGESAAAWGAQDVSEGLESPHELFKRGGGLKIVDDMMLDNCVGAFITMKKVGALASGWKIEPASDDDPVAHEHAEHIEQQFEQMTGTMSHALKAMLTAIEYGYSITNRVYHVPDAGPLAGKVALQKLKTKMPHRFKFKVDDFGNVIGLRHVSPGSFRYEDLPLEPFVIYTYASEFANPYGKPDTLRVHDRWNSKRWVDKFWDMYLERHAGGTVIAKYDRTAKPSKASFDAMRSFLNNRQVRSAWMGPDSWDITLHEVQGRSGQLYETAIDHRATAIARAILLPDLLGFSEKNTGAFALGKKHFDIFIMVLDQLRQDLEEVVVNEQIIRPLIDMNYGEQDAYPKFVFEPLTDDQKLQYISMAATAVEKGILDVDDAMRDKVRTLLELPPREEVTVDTAGRVGNERDDDGASAAGRRTQTDTQGSKQSSEGDEGSGKRSFADGDAGARKLTLFERKVNVPGIVSTVNAFEQQMFDVWTATFEDMQTHVIDWLRRTDPQTVEEAVALKFGGKTRTLGKAAQRYALASTFYGALEAQRELDRARAGESASPSPSRFAGVSLGNVPLDQVSQLFVDDGLVMTADIKRAAQFMKSEAFHISGIESEKVLNETRQVIIRGIKRGDTNWTEAQVKRVFAKYIKSGEITDAALGEAWRVKTIVRNANSTAFNEGRRAWFESKTMRDFVVAYQWSAVLDSNTTRYCEGMDGKVFTKEAINSEGWPPAHHNCRSFIIPITKGEKYTTSRIPRSVTRGVGFCDCYSGEIVIAA